MKHARGRPSYTLPLFEEPGSLASKLAPPSPGAIRQETKAEDLVLEVYSSAQLHAHALGAAVLRSPHPRERWALRRLVSVEEERKQLAADLLREIWQIQIGPRPELEHAWGKTRDLSTAGFTSRGGLHDHHAA